MPAWFPVSLFCWWHWAVRFYQIHNSIHSTLTICISNTMQQYNANRIQLPAGELAYVIIKMLAKKKKNPKIQLCQLTVIFLGKMISIRGTGPDSYQLQKNSIFFFFLKYIFVILTFAKAWFSWPRVFFWPSNGVLHPLLQIFNILYKDRTSKFLLVVSPQFSRVKSHIWQEFDMYLIFSKKKKTKKTNPVFKFSSL